MVILNKKIDMVKVFIYTTCIILGLLCIFPFLLIIGGSVTSEKEIISEGYKIIPKEFSFTAYKLIALQPKVMLNGYRITTIVTVSGTLASIIISSMLGYVLSVQKIRFRKILAIYVLITMLFNGGMVPWYIICVKVLGLRNNIFALIVPYLVNAWNVFLLRNYFQSIPNEIAESATIDGAGDFTIFTRIILPMAVPVISTVSLFIALVYWNDWWLGIMLVDSAHLKPLQILLRSIVSNIQFLNSNPEAGQMLKQQNLIPAESIKLATAVVTVGPIVFLYPFIQRYFVKGLMIGSIKG